MHGLKQDVKQVSNKSSNKSLSNKLNKCSKKFADNRQTSLQNELLSKPSNKSVSTFARKPVSKPQPAKQSVNRQCCVVLCWVVLHRIALGCVALCCFVLRCVVLCCYEGVLRSEAKAH